MSTTTLAQNIFSSETVAPVVRFTLFHRINVLKPSYLEAYKALSVLGAGLGNTASLPTSSLMGKNCKVQNFTGTFSSPALEKTKSPEDDTSSFDMERLITGMAQTLEWTGNEYG